MSQDNTQSNIDLLRSGYDAWNRGDIESVLETYDHEIEWHLPEGGINTGVYRGRDAIREFWESYLDAFEYLRMEPERFFEVTPELIVVFVRSPAKGKGSGVEVEILSAHTWTIRDGKALRCEITQDLDKALEAVGLSESVMSQENVEMLRSIYAAWERGDFSSIEWAHPEIELVNDDGPAPGTYRGVAGIAEGWRDFLSAWEDYRVEVEEYRELDGERVLVLMLHCGRGRRSGMEVGQMGTKRAGANVFHVSDGRVRKLILYWDRENAFADLGLSE